jgi:hypothetical protein
MRQLIANRAVEVPLTPPNQRDCSQLIVTQDIGFEVRPFKPDSCFVKTVRVRLESLTHPRYHAHHSSQTGIRLEGSYWKLNSRRDQFSGSPPSLLFEVLEDRPGCLGPVECVEVNAGSSLLQKIPALGSCMLDAAALNFDATVLH